MRRLAVWERWRGLISSQADSGLSIAEFCRQNDLPQASFYQWRRKLREQKSQTFVPVSIVGDAGVRIDFPCGAVLRCAADDSQALEQIVSILVRVEADA